MMAASLIACLAGCTITVERDGDGAFLSATRTASAADPPRSGPKAWKRGLTTSTDVARELGPPDEIVRWGDELWFRYGFHDLRSSTFVLSAYGARVFSTNASDKVESSLVVAFDERNRYLYSGVSKGPQVRSGSKFVVTPF